MNPQDSSPFFSSSQMQGADNPFISSRSFWAFKCDWLVWFHTFGHFFVLFAFNLAIGLFNLNTRSLNYDFIQLFNSLAGLGFIVIMVVYFYFEVSVSVVYTTWTEVVGWLSCSSFHCWMSFRALSHVRFGTAGINRYGLPRDTAIWEKYWLG